MRVETEETVETLKAGRLGQVGGLGEEGGWVREDRGREQRGRVGMGEEGPLPSAQGNVHIHRSVPST